MGVSYNFDEKDNNNSKFVKRIRQIRLSLIILLGTSGALIVSSFLTIFAMWGADIANIVLTIIDSLSFLVNLPVIVMLLFGLDELRDKIDNTKRSFLRFAVIFLGIYIGYYFISTIAMIFVLSITGFQGSYVVSKNLMCFIFISISLVFISLAFNKMSRQGYPTKLLVTPLISLPLVAIVGFVFGWIVAFTYPFHYGEDVVLIGVIIAIYLSIAQLMSLLEMFLRFNKMHNETLLNLAPELLHTKENEKKEKKKVEKVVKAEKAVGGK